MIDCNTLYERPSDHGYLDRNLRDSHHRAIVRQLLLLMGLHAGQQVLEIGAGSGRYTRLLLEEGLHVHATDPDPVLYAKLQKNLGSQAGLFLWNCSIQELPPEFALPHALCGFHVLHHLDEPALRSLCALLRHFAAEKHFGGWFFLEPNPHNPLYPLQILLSPAMHFREERGIWANDYRRVFESEDVPYEDLGHIGLLPPALSHLLPDRLLTLWSPRVRAGHCPVSLYRIIGYRHGKIRATQP